MSNRLRKSNSYSFFAGWGEFVFFKTDDGVLWACGKNSNGQLSLNSDESKVLSPQMVKTFPAGTKKEINTVSVGGWHALFLTRNFGRRGEECAFSCGRNDFCELADSTSIDRYGAVPVLLESKNEAICGLFCGIHTLFALTTSGSVYSAGKGSGGMLGHGKKEKPGQAKVKLSLSDNISVGKRIQSLKGIVNVFTGPDWVIFKSKSQSLFGCGRTNRGELPVNNSDSNQYVPIEITYFKEKGIKIDSVVASFNTAYFLTHDRKVYCTGTIPKDTYDYVEKTLHSENEPVLSRALSGFQQFCTGNTMNFIVYKKNGSFFANGSKSSWFGIPIKFNMNPDGEPFDRDMSEMESEGVKSLNRIENNIADIVTRFSGTYVICTDGSIYATGSGHDGELMDGKGKPSDKFIFVGKYKLRRKRMQVYMREKGLRLKFLQIQCHIKTLTSVIFLSGKVVF